MQSSRGLCLSINTPESTIALRGLPAVDSSGRQLYNLMEWAACFYDFDIYLGRFLALRISNGRPSNADRDQDFRSLGIGSRRSDEHTSELQSLMRISYAV